MFSEKSRPPRPKNIAISCAAIRIRRSRRSAQGSGGLRTLGPPELTQNEETGFYPSAHDTCPDHARPASSRSVDAELDDLAASQPRESVFRPEPARAAVQQLPPDLGPPRTPLAPGHEKKDVTGARLPWFAALLDALVGSGLRRSGRSLHLERIMSGDSMNVERRP